MRGPAAEGLLEAFDQAV